MNRRERLLAIGVGLMVALLGGLWLINGVLRGFEQRESEITRLSQEVTRKKTLIRQGEAAERKLKSLAPQSLPVDVETARSQYQAWLLETAEEVGLKDVHVSVLGARAQKDVFVQHPFQMNARGSLEQLTRFLYEYYSVARLQRISRLGVKPNPETRDLDLAMVFEAIALTGAKDTKTLNTSPSNRLEQGDMDEYVRTIVNRNFVSPPNHAPELVVSSTQNAFRNKPFSLDLKGKDADATDQLSYALLDKAPPGASIDPKTGAFRWTPSELGEFEISFTVTDSGHPAQVTTAKTKIIVVEPPPEAPPAPPAPSFEVARHAFVTAITEVNGRRQIWLSIRTEGKMLKLYEGDSLKVGPLEGTVKRIEERSAEIDLGGKSQRVPLGQPLVQAEG